MSLCDVFQAKSTAANNIREQNNEAQLKIKELEHNINKHRKESRDAADKVQNTVNFAPQCLSWITGLLSYACFSLQVSRMLEEHDWIQSERQFFGQPNTPYNFKTNNPREAGQRLKKLEETTTKLERNINKRAMNMLNEAEERVRTRGVCWNFVGLSSHSLCSWPTVQWPDEKEEDCGEWQNENLADNWGAGPEEKWGP